jgi:cytochrome b
VQLGRVRVWDLPTRLFHWTLAGLMVFSVVTAKIGGNATEWHFRSGYAILALLVFRLLWGFAGDRYARFAQFVRGPAAVFSYFRGKMVEPLGHNPLGALSVLALLAALFVQACTGLFATDAIFTEGPLAKLVSSAVSERLTSIHHLNEKLLYALVALHLAAIAYYQFGRGRNLTRSMLDGNQSGDPAQAASDDRAIRARALLLFVLAALLVGYVVNL